MAFAGRHPEADLDDKVARQILEANISKKSTVDSIAEYSQLGMRRRGPWSELLKHRSLIGDLFAASNGLLVKQVGFGRQVAGFLRDAGIPHCADDVEKILYRVRCMMAHALDHKRNGRKPDLRHAAFNAVLDGIRLPDEPMQPLQVAQPAIQSLQVVSMAPFTMGTPDNAIADRCIEVCSSVSSDDEGIFFAATASTPFRAPDAPLATPIVEIKSDVLCQAPPSHVGDEEIDEMLKGNAMGPTSHAYISARKKNSPAILKKPSSMLLKRPSSHMVAASSEANGGVDSKVARKNTYSRAYHAKKAVLQKQGRDPETCIKSARAAGQKAVEAMLSSLS